MEERVPISYRKIFRMMLPCLKQEWAFLPLFVVLSVLIAVLSLSEPFIYGSVIDRIISALREHRFASETFQTLLPFLIAWIAVVFASTGCTAVFSYARWYFGYVLSGWFFREVYARMLQRDVRRFQEEQAGEILRRFNNAWDAVFIVNEHVVRDYLQAFLLFVFAVVIGFWIDWRLALVSLVPVPMIIGIGLFNMKVTEPGQHDVNQLWDEASGKVGDAFSNIATVKSFSGEQRSVREVFHVYEAANRKQRAVNRHWAFGEAATGGIYVAGRLCIFFFGSYFVLNGTTSVGTLLMFLGFEGFMFGAVQQIAGSLLDMSRALSRLNRATNYWYEIPDVRDTRGAKNIRRLQGEVTFENVSYTYRDSLEVLRNISFRIPKGETFAVVGESGAGKSTLAQMLLRFHDPTSGRILIDGYDIRKLTLKSLRSNIGFVMQENALFHDTILNNILFAKPGASEREVVRAAKRAQAHQFIMGLKNGYKTVVGERGVKLSGGEKQRVALARVFLADPPILVLDEATSALDSKTEHALQMALHEVMRDRTTLVIAHRLSTVMNAHSILVLHKGSIVDQGIHQDLISRGGLYQQYWNIQAGGYVYE